MINLDEYKIYVESHKMEMVPLSIAKQAIEDAQIKQLDQAINQLSLELTSLKPDLSLLDDKDSTRES